MSDQLLMTSLFSSCLWALAADNDLALQTFVLFAAAMFRCLAFCVCTVQHPKFGFQSLIMFTPWYWEPYICNNVGVEALCVSILSSDVVHSLFHQ